MTLFSLQFISPFYFPLLAPFLLCVGLVQIIMKEFILISAFDLVLDPCLVDINSVGSNGPSSLVAWLYGAQSNHSYVLHVGHINGFLGCLCGPNF